MGISDAKQYIGKKCDIHWLDRAGREFTTVSMIHDVTYVPMYGGYLITDSDDIRLDKVVAVHVSDETAAVPLAA